MKKVLVTGSEGQLGTSIRKASGKFRDFICTFIDISDLDLANTENVRRYFATNYFDYIINCAGYTAVDQAEMNPQTAFSINGYVPQLLSEVCQKGTRLIHMSTDYVYDGSKNVPHSEDDIPEAISIYALSKLAGEKALWNNPDCLIIRTSWLYGEHGNNFLKTIIRLSEERNEIGVVYDQAGTPTYSGDLAEVLFGILIQSELSSFKAGIFNYSNEGVCSWYDFACEIVNFTGGKCRIKPIRTHEYPVPAHRPVYSVMDKSKIKRIFGIEIPHWRESLQLAMKNLSG
jgi:dTDP-4-dehydrorhamnose reductase